MLMLCLLCVFVHIVGSSTDVSEDWEKDFDLDMTEEEVQMALSKVDATEEVCFFTTVNEVEMVKTFTPCLEIIIFYFIFSACDWTVTTLCFFFLLVDACIQGRVFVS